MSVLYGQIQPGGFVNLITKKPQANPVTSVELRGNTYASRYRGLFDVNGGFWISILPGRSLETATSCTVLPASF